jgi:Kef-type K+ transport system membrane component KefB
MMAQLLSLGLRRLKQPKVIAEVLGGILLGQFYSSLPRRII